MERTQLKSLKGTDRMVKERLRLRTVLGVSNISFGLPNRHLVNRTFLTMALTSGLDSAIMLGHNEYGRTTLAEEYWRDTKNGTGGDVRIPVNYFENDDPEGEIKLKWRSHGNLLFTNWLNYYVYQEAPYDYLINKDSNWINSERSIDK